MSQQDSRNLVQENIARYSGEIEASTEFLKNRGEELLEIFDGKVGDVLERRGISRDLVGSVGSVVLHPKGAFNSTFEDGTKIPHEIQFNRYGFVSDREATGFQVVDPRDNISLARLEIRPTDRRRRWNTSISTSSETFTYSETEPSEASRRMYRYSTALSSLVHIGEIFDRTDDVTIKMRFNDNQD